MTLRKKLEAVERELARAVRSLQQAGYTDNGGEYWKPPLGKPYDIQLADAFYKVANHLTATAQQQAHVADLLCKQADSICEEGIALRKKQQVTQEAGQK